MPLFEAAESGWGLDAVLSLQAGRVEWLDLLVTLLDFMGDELFFIALLALIYWVFNKGLGMRMYFALIVISLAVFTFKDLFGRPRPFQFSADVMPLFAADGFGIPSGHTALALVIWGYLAYALRRTWVTVLVVAYVVLQAWGRVYAGVHYPQDVVAGAVLGLVTLALYIPTAERVAPMWLARPLWQQAIAVLVVGALGVVLYTGNDDALTVVGLLVGGSLAASLEHRSVQFQVHAAPARRAAQYALGLVLSIVLLFGLDILFGESEPANILRVLRYALVALFALALWPYLSIRTNLMRSTTARPQAQAV